jgi:BMFP domain-containing protein YqiC
MQTKGRIFDDLARVANGAVTTLVGIKGEVEAVVRQRVERLLSEADLVPRDEFEAVKAMAANARAEQEALERRVVDLESRLAAAGAPKTKAKAKPRATAKAKAKRPKKA